MKAPDESGINKDFTEKSTDWIATDDKRCTDVWRAFARRLATKRFRPHPKPALPAHDYNGDLLRD